MLISAPATAVSLCLMPLGIALAATPPAAHAVASVTPATTVPANATLEGSAADAAARHAKRTECVKEAKARKLVGADKNSFIKDCIAAH